MQITLHFYIRKSTVCNLQSHNTGSHNGPTSRTQGAPGNPRPTNSPLYVTVEYIGRADVPKTGITSQRYAKPTEQEGIVIERD